MTDRPVRVRLRAAPGRHAACLLGAMLLAAGAGGGAAAGGSLQVVGPEGAVLADLPLAPDGRWCLHWAHSVTGAPVTDCFRVMGETMLLDATRMEDFSAGLGHLPGRGTLRGREGGGYAVDDMAVPLPDGVLRLRVGGPAVGHRLTSGTAERALSAIAAGRRVTLRPAPAAARAGPPGPGAAAAAPDGPDAGAPD